MKCDICENNCIIENGTMGKCKLYSCVNDQIIERFPNRYLIISPISIETMPILHFEPRGKFLQLSTVGCNLNCEGCVSTVIVKEIAPHKMNTKEKRPEEIIKEALEKECIGIVFLMNDPLASWPTFLSVAKKAKEVGLLVGCSSNSLFTESSLDQILPYLDFINVGMKGFTEEAYHHCGAKSIKPIWRNIQRLHNSGVHLEISYFYKKGGEEDIKNFAREIARISQDIPLHIQRFIPVEESKPSREPSIKEAENLWSELRRIIKYAYIFNSPGTETLNTYCPKCGSLLFRRGFYGPMGARVNESHIKVENEVECEYCQSKIAMVMKKTRGVVNAYQEASFEGGYPFVMALEMLESIFIALGTHDKNRFVSLWNKYINNPEMLKKLSGSLQNSEQYIQTVRNIGKDVGLIEKSELLADYLSSVLSNIKQKHSMIKEKPKVYYAMGKPLFGISGGRMETQLVEVAGGISVNKDLRLAGRAGVSLTCEQLNSVNPDVIIISSFFSQPVEDFALDCQKAGIIVNAVKNHKIFNFPVSTCDFGSPRWIIALMHIANVLHPDIYNFDVLAEADKFYRLFYNMPFIAEDVNRSFSKTIL